MTRNAGPRGPGYFNLDMSLVKRIKVNGRVTAELRADAFNATNTPHFANPGRDFGTPDLRPGDGHAGHRPGRHRARGWCGSAPA